MQMNETQSSNPESATKSTSESSAKQADCGLFIKQLEDLINQHMVYAAPNVQKFNRKKNQRLLLTLYA